MVNSYRNLSTVAVFHIGSRARVAIGPHRGVIGRVYAIVPAPPSAGMNPKAEFYALETLGGDPPKTLCARPEELEHY